MNMAGESWELPSMKRVVIAQPAVNVPGEEIPPPTPEEARAADAVFSKEEETADAAGVFGLWSAGMLLNDLLQNACRTEEEDETEEKKKKPALDDKPD
jgi:hypothetical protein